MARHGKRRSGEAPHDIAVDMFRTFVDSLTCQEEHAGRGRDTTAATQYGKWSHDADAQSGLTTLHG
jgi:hypothetical protein